MFLNKKDDKAELPEAEVKKLMDGHMANINRLAKDGKLVAAGPFEGGGGLFIFKSGMRDSVSRWIMTDPAVVANRWNVEVFSYLPRTGSVCAVGENYDMTNYFLVRYTSKESVSIKEFRTHYAYLHGAGTLIAEADLGKGEGSLAVFRDEPTETLLNADPLVSTGKLKAEKKKLFIARGSFCEPK